MDPIQRLTEHFEHFPGIGPRQAKRFVYHLLKSSPAVLQDIAHSLSLLKRHMRICDACFRFFEPNGNALVCPFCTDTRRDHNVLMIVSKDIDLENIERSGSYRGLYFVLGGTIPILEKNPERKVRSRELLKRILDEKLPQPTEIIIALNSTPEGDNTADFLTHLLEPLLQKTPFTISTLGRGLSTGLELEYSDGDTIKHAIKNRSHL